MFTIDDYKEMEADIRRDKLEAYAMAKFNWERKIRINQFLDERETISDDFEAMETPEEMIGMLNEFTKRVKDLPYHQEIGFSLKLDAFSYYDNCSVEENHYCYTYAVLQSEENIENNIKSSVRKEFERKLKPIDYYSSAKSVDCNVMRLFVDEKIDFSMLQEIVYAECQI